MKQSKIVLTIVTAALLLLPASLQSQQMGGSLPAWTDENRRPSMYPASVWLTGYASRRVGSNDKQDQVRQHVMASARGELAAAISSTVIRVLDQKTMAELKISGDNIKRTVEESVSSSSSADLAMVDVDVHFDEKNKTYYAFAMAKRADLASFYASRINFHLTAADNEFKQAGQYFDTLDRRGSAQEEIAKSKANIIESNKHYGILLALGSPGEAERLQEKSAQLVSNIARLETRILQSGAIFVTGKETYGNRQYNYLIPAVQSQLSANGCRVADKKEDADYILTINATDHNISKSGSFWYCYAKVDAAVVNSKTKKQDWSPNFIGEKGAHTTEERACQDAMKKAANQMWNEIRTKTELCR